MPVVNREVVLPVPRERAWELVTEPEELETWLADAVEFEPEEGAPLRTEDGGEVREGVVEHVDAEERIVFTWGESIVEWRLDDHPAAPASWSPSTGSPRTAPCGARPAGARARRRAVPGVDVTESARCSPLSPTRPAARSSARFRAAGPDRLATRERAADDPPGRDQAPRRARPRGARRGRREGRELRYTLTPAPLTDAMALDGRRRRAVGRRAWPGWRSAGEPPRRARHRRRRRDRPRRGGAADRRRARRAVGRPRGRRRAARAPRYAADLTTREGNRAPSTPRWRRSGASTWWCPTPASSTSRPSRSSPRTSGTCCWR